MRLDRGDVEREGESAAHPLYQPAVAGADLPYERSTSANERSPADTPQPRKAARGCAQIVGPPHERSARQRGRRNGWFRIRWRHAPAR